MANQFINVTVKQNPKTRKAGYVFEDKNLLIPITSIAYAKFYLNNDYEIVLRKDISLKDAVGYDDYQVFATKADLGI